MATSNTARSRNNRGAERQANRRTRKEGGGGFKRFLLMLLIVLLVIAVSVGATLYYIWKQDGLPFLSNDSTETVSEQSDGTPPIPAVVQPAPDATPIFTSLEPFTVTLTDGQRSRILYVAITLRVDNDESRLLLTEFMPVVRDRVLRTLSAQNPFYVQTPHGREELVEVLADVLREPFSSNPNNRAFISNVLFTAFVVQ